MARRLSCCVDLTVVCTEGILVCVRLSTRLHGWNAVCADASLVKAWAQRPGFSQAGLPKKGRVWDQEPGPDALLDTAGRTEAVWSFCFWLLVAFGGVAFCGVFYGFLGEKSSRAGVWGAVLDLFQDTWLLQGNILCSVFWGNAPRLEASGWGRRNCDLGISSLGGSGLAF